ncbi:YbgF trimerization domain-containing protein [Alkanindiges illinoisensis]|uniref:YbgF trimerization domain-containing protein n=1 Tax=Alkanindiges illinoisensis TaxID=197183 RepID=UPI000B120C07|nr:YbgF trimerization domain-containing protein [Alkanindiges illinoisensis]
MASFSISKKFMQGMLLAGTLGITALPQAQAVPIEQGSLTQANNSSVATAGTVATDDQGSTLWQLYQQVQQLQQEVRELRGQLESQQDTLDRTQKEVKNRYTDLDQRLELLKEQTQPADENSDNPDDVTGNGDTNSAAPDTNSPISNAPVSNTPADIPKPAAKTTSPAPDATPPVSGTPSAPANSKPSSGNTLYVQQDASNDKQPDKQAYISAYDAYKAGGASKAIKPMQQFIASFPNSVYVPNAYYWLGEFYLASNPADFVKAKKSFNEVINKYPKSAKASTALYRVATITQEIDKRTSEATALMKKLVRDYSGSPEAQYARSFITAHP